jgi:hypothetical protein
VDLVGDPSVETRRANVDVFDVLALEMPVELGLELCTVVGLHDKSAERQAMEHFIDEPNGRALIARVVHLQDANARGVVDAVVRASTPSGALTGVTSDGPPSAAQTKHTAITVSTSFV